MGRTEDKRKMKIQVVLAASEGKILENGAEKEHMVYLYGEDELPDISGWREIPESEIPSESEVDML